HPTAQVTRGDFAQSLVFNTPLRQSLANAPLYLDVTGPIAAIAEAVTANGSTLRDYDFTPSGMLAPSFGSSFLPDNPITRLYVAVALVKALGLDASAQSLAGSNVTATSGGQTVVVSDLASIPASLRGYVQVALDRGILSAPFTSSPLAATVSPAGPVTRSSLAFALDHFRQAFAAGNSGIVGNGSGGSSLIVPLSLGGLLGELTST